MVKSGSIITLLKKNFCSKLHGKRQTGKSVFAARVIFLLQKWIIIALAFEDKQLVLFGWLACPNWMIGYKVCAVITIPGYNGCLT